MCRVVPSFTESSLHHLTRQMGNLWVAKERLWRYLLRSVNCDLRISLMDSFPVPTCRFARAYRRRLLPEGSAFGNGEMSKQTFYGMRAHLRICWPGVIVDMNLAPANVPDLHMAEELLLEGGGAKG